MIWIILALLTAFFESLKDVSGKKSLEDVDEYIVAWAWSFFSLPFLIIILSFTEIPDLNNQFWMALFSGGSLNVFAWIFYIKAIKYSDLSITVPMVNFTPLFLLLTSPLMVGEFPTLFGLIGVVLIVAGSYLLNITEKSKGLLHPFRALLSEKGPRFMLIVAVIWSISSNIDKVGITSSSPLFWAFAINAYISSILLGIMIVKSRQRLKIIPSHLSSLLPIGLFSALTWAFQMTALKLTLVAYVIAIKRTSTMMSAYFGHIIFKEKGSKERVAGTLIMILGVLSIALA